MDLRSEKPGTSHPQHSTRAPSRRRFRLPALWLALATLAGGVLLSAFEREPLEVFKRRRAELMESVKDGIVVLFGQTPPEDIDYLPFRQTNDFYYLTGSEEPNVALLLVPSSSEGGNGREIFFLPLRDPAEERWTGPKIGAGDPGISEVTGFAEVMPPGHLPAQMGEALKRWNKIYTLTSGGEGGGNSSFLGRLRQLAPFASIENVAPEIAKLRSVKSAGEIDLIRKSTEATIEAHFAAMQAVRPGVYEYEIAALMKYEYERRGCERSAYPPIVGSGFNSTVLHYDKNRRRMEAGDMLVLDVGGEYSGYATDITRTLPVSGRFTKRQREIYEIVLGAQRAAIAAARPGASLRRTGPNSLHRIALEYLNEEGKKRLGEPLGEYFIHGLGHHVGLAVHDPSERSATLQPGMVITIEPGVYIPDEGLGVRIEDMILITEDGNEVMTRRLPRDPDEIEKIMAGGKRRGNR